MKLREIETRNGTRFELSRKGDYSIVITAEYGNTRSGFKHTARVEIWDEKNGKDYDSDYKKVLYYNRTWECFRYETAIENAFSAILKTIKNKSEKARITALEEKVLNLKREHKTQYTYIGL